jgi:hypothetical protein
MASSILEPGPRDVLPQNIAAERLDFTLLKHPRYPSVSSCEMAPEVTPKGKSGAHDVYERPVAEFDDGAAPSGALPPPELSDRNVRCFLSNERMNSSNPNSRHMSRCRYVLAPRLSTEPRYFWRLLQRGVKTLESGDALERGLYPDGNQWEHQGSNKGSKAKTPQTSKANL